MSLKTAIESIKEWMRANDAPQLVANLSRGTTKDHLDRVEKAQGVTFPRQLRELYLLHDGQPEEFDCFIEAMNFLGVEAAAYSRATLLARYVTGTHGVLAHPSEIPLLEDEMSDRWWPIARMDGDMVVMNLDSGRVFFAHKDVPPFKLAANDLAGFFHEYARRLDAGLYELDEGFGDYYLASDEPWTPPTLRVVSPAKKVAAASPRETASRVFDEILGKNLFFQLEELTVKGKSVVVELALHSPKSWLARLKAHPVITEPVGKFTKALKDALPAHDCRVEFVPIEVGLSQLALYLKHSGPAGADLLREIR